MSRAQSGSPATLETAEEIRLIAGAKHGDHQSFETLVDRYMGRAVTVATGYLGDRHEALDLVQEAFYRVFKTLDRFRDGEPFAPWFYRILRNACLNHLEKRKHRRALSIHARSVEEAEMPLPAGTLSPPGHLEGKETVQMFWQMLEKLPQRHREILLLRHFEDMDYAQMAEVLEIPIGTVMSRLFHARQKLRNLMAPHMEDRS